MSKAWRTIGWIVMILFVLGLVLCGAGWLTGASLTRMADLAFGGTDVAVDAGKAAVERLTGLWQSLSICVSGLF